MRIIFYFSVLLFLFGCQGEDDGARGQVNNSIVVDQVEKKELKLEHKKDIAQSLADRMNTVKFDKFKEVSFWESRPLLEFDSVSYFYIVIPENMDKVITRIVYSYRGSDWIFFDRIQILADDVKVFDKKFSQEDISRRVDDGKVIESVDFIVDDDIVKSYDKIAGAVSSVIRFSGKKEKDVVVTSAEKMNFAKMVEVYDDARKIDGLSSLNLTRRIKEEDDTWKIVMIKIKPLKKDIISIKEKSKKQCLLDIYSNMTRDIWFLSGPIRKGYKAAEEDFKCVEKLEFHEKFKVSKHIVYKD